MYLSLRTKLILIVGTASVSLCGVLVLDRQLATQQDRNLQQLEQQLVPKLELEPRLSAQFEQLGQALRDGVAAQDRAAVEATDARLAGMNAVIDQAGHALEAGDAQLLREALLKYHRLAINVSLRMLDGEAGEALVRDMDVMQEQHKAAQQVIERVARLDRGTLRSGFASLHDAAERAARYRLSVGLLSVLLVSGLSIWLFRAALTSLGRITRGFDRFARGELDQPIALSSQDEIGELAQEANRMAASLKELSAGRDAADWVKAGQLELAEALSGQLDPAEAARSGLYFLARRLQAMAGALYLENGADELELMASFALPEDEATARASRRFRVGQGLVGQAALESSIVSIDGLPANYLNVSSGLGQVGSPFLTLVPLRRAERVLGVVELASLAPLGEAARELLQLTRESLAAALESTRSRARLQQLLGESQRLATRLTAQEEELIQNNNELTAQQEELRLANDELESQRSSLRSRNTELEQARASLLEKADELGRVSSYKSQFLANMSHELRTPLNSMLLLSQILADNEAGNLTTKQVEHCRTIYSAGKGLLGLINQVLDLSKIEAGKQDLHVEPVLLHELAGHLKRTFEPQFTNKGIHFSVEVAPDIPLTIMTDGQVLQRILINLLGNALKFTEHGEVALRITRPGPNYEPGRPDLPPESSVSFSVRDTGVGIPAQIQERIFARFEQADARTVRRYGGTGLGLAIARESAMLMGGELSVESAEGQGSTFRCCLPEVWSAALAGPLALARLSSLPPRVVSDDRAQLGDDEPHLLIVEDDPTFAERLLETVRSLGLKAVVAHNGREALRLARSRPPAGVLLDVRLPDIDGFAVRQELRAEPRTSSIPVHFVSAQEAPRGPLSTDSVGYLEKPASRDAIVKVIQSMIRPAPTGSSRVLVIEDDEDQAQIIIELLEKAHLQAIAARTADDAVRALRSERFGCVILDLGLPDTDGLRLLEKLKTQSDIWLPPVVVHTGRALSRDETRRLREYAEAVVLKEGRSAARLVDEVQSFVGQVRGNLQHPSPVELQALANSDVVLEGTKVLIADDDMRTVYALSALLRGKGADVLVAETGREALRVLDEHQNVGVVLMDIMMPDMDGYEAMRRLRAEERFAELPVIALTARAMKGERERCEEAGANDYMTKPVDPRGLLMTLRHWLGRDGVRESLS